MVLCGFEVLPGCYRDAYRRAFRKSVPRNLILVDAGGEECTERHQSAPKGTANRILYRGKTFSPRRAGFRVLPATKACLQGFREFLRCYRSATGDTTKAGALG